MDISIAPRSRGSLFHRLAPGILIAATGVGAGDLITASIAGSKVGLAILWAVAVGAVLKWVLNEGLARWQMATGTTLLEGWVDRLGTWIQWLFLIYFLPWALATGAALITACGVAGAAIWDFGLPFAQAKVIWGIAHSLVGLVLVWIGGFRLFEKVMSVCIAVMFVAVMVTAVAIKPDWGAMLRGLFVPAIPNPNANLPWVLGLLGGVGGSVTLLSYGYWIREERRSGAEGVATCRVDLSVGYVMTALFGIAMVAIGSRLVLEKGASDRVALALAGQLAGFMGPAGKWAFLIGFWGAVFSSLLGVWQSVPYLFADFMLIRKGVGSADRAELDYTKLRAYRAFLVALALVPMLLVGRELGKIQLVYAVMAALFMPLLALTLLLLNNRTDWVGKRFRSGYLVNILLVATLAFFAWVFVRQVKEKLLPSKPVAAAVQPNATPRN
ncbi:MAG: Nramp family divalent metal transporter [Phycisphaerales bacterium]|nr:Nramp family divalent metal transporter [Phycisphaerales bacterium]